MSIVFKNDSIEAAQLITLVANEQSRALSPRELRHRLAGHGYGLEDTSEGMIVTKLPFGNALCMIPKVAIAA